MNERQEDREGEDKEERKEIEEGMNSCLTL
jgi:hypothetical protein